MTKPDAKKISGQPRYLLSGSAGVGEFHARPIFHVRPSHHDLERIIRQWPLQRLGLIPRRASFGAGKSAVS
jgi:hypothetical protein